MGQVRQPLDGLQPVGLRGARKDRATAVSSSYPVQWIAPGAVPLSHSAAESSENVPFAEAGRLSSPRGDSTLTFLLCIINQHPPHIFPVGAPLAFRTWNRYPFYHLKATSDDTAFPHESLSVPHHPYLPIPRSSVTPKSCRDRLTRDSMFAMSTMPR